MPLSLYRLSAGQGNHPDYGARLKKRSDTIYSTICNPQKVAYELLANGMNDSWLYPEMPIVSNVLENRMVF